MVERMECLAYDEELCDNGCKHAGVHKKIEECNELFFDSCRVLVDKVSCTPVKEKGKDELIEALHDLTDTLVDFKETLDGFFGKDKKEKGIDDEIYQPVKGE